MIEVQRPIGSVVSIFPHLDHTALVATSESQVPAMGRCVGTRITLAGCQAFVKFLWTVACFVCPICPLVVGYLFLYGVCLLL